MVESINWLVEIKITSTEPIWSPYRSTTHQKKTTRDQAFVIFTTSKLAHSILLALYIPPTAAAQGIL